MTANLLKTYFNWIAGKDSSLAALPEGIDPCGENGEFHTFCFDGPIFSSPVSFKLGEKYVGNTRIQKKGNHLLVLGL